MKSTQLLLLGLLAPYLAKALDIVHSPAAKNVEDTQQKTTMLRTATAPSLAQVNSPDSTPSLADAMTRGATRNATLRVKGDSELKVLKYQNARCTLGAQTKLLWYPHMTWWHWFFRGSVTRDHNDFYQPHDFLIGRLNTVPCQVSDASIVSHVAPLNTPAQKPPSITWVAATYKAGPFSFWAYDEAGNSMCRFCFARESWEINKEACDTMIKRLSGNGEFDCSYEVDNHLAESNIAYVGHDIPSYWSSDYVWTRVIFLLLFIFGCYCFAFCCTALAGGSR